MKKLAILAALATLTLGATTAPAEAANRPAPQRADSGWGCGGAC